MNYQEETLGEFLSGIASERVAPAGGTAAAVVGAIGAALCEMVCIHSLERTGDSAASGDLVAVREDLREERTHLLNLAVSDATLVDDLFGESSGDVDQEGFKRAVGVPFTIAAASLNVLELATDVTENGDGNAILDAGTAVFLVHSALRASVFTVRSNLEHVSDSSYSETIEADVAEIETLADEAVDTALDHIERRT